MVTKAKNKQVADIDEVEAQTDEVEAADPADDDENAVETTPQASRRLPHVDAEQFAALRDELKMSNKEVAEAIGRTVARVSELTYSQGASIQTWERYETDVRAWREAHPIEEESETANEA